LLGHTPNETARELFGRLARLLVDSALEQPRVLVHRDFHSRNLMLQEDEGQAVIDFQDAVIGPVTYDLVSLLRDCYIRWPSDQVSDWALAYRDQLIQAGLLEPVEDSGFIRWFDLMGLQRHIKVLGTFARLYLRDGKPGYLEDLPLVVDYVREMLEKYSEEEPVFGEFRDWFETALDPLIATQNWSAKP
jgi:aminoglycoside/choline kinase family phosphotransferase